MDQHTGGNGRGAFGTGGCVLSHVFPLAPPLGSRFQEGIDSTMFQPRLVLGQVKRSWTSVILAEFRCDVPTLTLTTEDDIYLQTELQATHCWLRMKIRPPSLLEGGELQPPQASISPREGGGDGLSLLWGSGQPTLTMAAVEYLPALAWGSNVLPRGNEETGDQNEGLSRVQCV